MRSLKQDLVGFHWSAFFEPRLPFTGVPVKKIPLPHLLCSLTLFNFAPPPTHPFPSPPAAHLPAHHPVYILSTCNGNTHLSLLLFHLLPPLRPLTLFPALCIPLHFVTKEVRKWTPPHTHLHLHPPSHQTLITKTIPLSICKTLRGPSFFLSP